MLGFSSLFLYMFALTLLCNAFHLRHKKVSNAASYMMAACLAIIRLFWGAPASLCKVDIEKLYSVQCLMAVYSVLYSCMPDVCISLVFLVYRRLFWGPPASLCKVDVEKLQLYNVEWLCLLCTVFVCAWHVCMFGVPFFFVIPCDFDIAIVNRLCTETSFFFMAWK